ncbi:hypothetical protein [Peribacillus loiseleuriae]|uniref:Swarming motility protein SwrB n=1 Tax=Peribacillus loiseleuriae TaxID=1679170 RepID=A0A0K9GT82_9BACI|nr:hypothetical protein [Peribacillus loiseleuriae]KMY49472.1 hypothetical protein AC625_07880 [Peribacillus loiseleuriae]
MSGFIMFIMFVLNIFTILAIIVLYTRQNRLGNFEKNQESRAREMEESMAAFVLELKGENDRLIRALAMKDAASNELNSSEKLLSRKTTSSSLRQSVGPSRQTVHAKEEDATSLKLPDLPITNDDKLEISTNRLVEHEGGSNQRTSFQETLKQELQNHEQQLKSTLSDQVNDLLQKGLTTEEVAKKLNKGKTEIELLLRFNRQS